MTGESVIRVAVEGAVLALIVSALCAALPRLRASHRALLWWLVSAKLLLGLAPLPAFRIVAFPAVEVKTTAPAAVSAASTPAATPPKVEPRAFVAWGWAAGASLLALAMIPGWLRVRRLVRSGRPIDDRLLPVAQRAARSAGLRRPPRVLTVAGLGTPLVTGLFRPAILLPAGALDRFAPEEIE